MPRLAAAACTALVIVAAHASPTFDTVKAGHRPSDVTVLDRQGRPLQTLRVDSTARRLPWLALDEFSPALRAAVILSEDQRFAEHGGIDWTALLRSAAQSLGGSLQGGSTLTMQLAGLIDAQHSRPRDGRSATAKVGQMWAARDIESHWAKPQILEAYLNLVPLRGELVGVPAAARVLFGKHASGLDQQEAAVLAAMIRAPNAPAARIARRACAVVQAQRLPCTGLEGLTTQALRGPGQPVTHATDAPHYARALWKALPAPQRQATSVPGTLDGALQRVAVQALRQQLAELRGRHVEDGAVVVLDNASGEVRAWVGSSGREFSDAAQVDAVQARRQPGSALKPFVYGLAFERRLITPTSLLDDSPAALPAGSGLYLPQNYDRRHHGWVSARIALASSLNVPAVKVGAMLGPDALFERLNAVGLQISHSGGWHGYALALGSAEVTLLDLTNAYRVLANGGRWSPVRLTAGSLREPVQVNQVKIAFDPATTWLVSDILADNTARAMTFGLDSALATRGWAAVKTGTSKDMRDNWCLGYTDRYTVGVWVGNASGAPMQRVSGTSGAAPVWHAVVQHLHAAQPSMPPATPAGIVWTTASHEPLLAGTEPPPGLAPTTPTTGARVTGIRTPAPGSVHALDPDMPPATQRIVFEGEAGSWWLDGRLIGHGPRVAWAPQPGRHVVVLKLADGREEQRMFEVRGATKRR